MIVRCYSNFANNNNDDNNNNNNNMIIEENNNLKLDKLDMIYNVSNYFVNKNVLENDELLFINLKFKELFIMLKISKMFLPKNDYNKLLRKLIEYLNWLIDNDNVIENIINFINNSEDIDKININKMKSEIDITEMNDNIITIYDIALKRNIELNNKYLNILNNLFIIINKYGEEILKDKVKTMINKIIIDFKNFGIKYKEIGGRKHKGRTIEWNHNDYKKTFDNIIRINTIEIHKDIIEWYKSENIDKFNEIDNIGDLIENIIMNINKVLANKLFKSKFYNKKMDDKKFNLLINIEDRNKLEFISTINRDLELFKNIYDDNNNMHILNNKIDKLEFNKSPLLQILDSIINSNMSNEDKQIHIENSILKYELEFFNENLNNPNIKSSILHNVHDDLNKGYNKLIKKYTFNRCSLLKKEYNKNHRNYYNAIIILMFLNLGVDKCISYSFSSILNMVNNKEIDTLERTNVLFELANRFIRLFKIVKKDENRLKTIKELVEPDELSMEILKLDDKFKFNLGDTLLRVITENCNIFSEEPKKISINNTIIQLKVNDKFTNDITLNGISILQLPMLIKPRTIKTKDDYYPYSLSDTTTLYNEGKFFRSKFDQKYETLSDPSFFNGINYINNIKFKINNQMLLFVVEEWDKPDSKLFNGYNKKLEILESDSKKDINIKKAHNSLYHLYNNILNIAVLYRNAEFYFPVFADFRGRIYPITNFLSYQGNDLARSLLLFSDGEKINKEGNKYLDVYLANLAGYDKLSWDTRLKKSKEIIKEIIQMDSILDYFNKHSDKISEPFQFISILYAKLDLIKNNYNNKIYNPILFDASCSGIQHIAALTLEKELAKNVNLYTDSNNPQEDLPQDFYTYALGKINKRLRESEISKLQNINFSRKIIKRSVMTIPYNISLSGVGDQLLEHFEKNWDINEKTYYVTIPGWATLNDTDIYLNSSEYGKLTKYTFEVLTQDLPSLKALNNYFNSIITMLVKLNLPITWKTPAGLKLRYTNIKFNAIKTKSKLVPGGKTVTISLPTGNINLAKMKRSFMPNFIHSLDAANVHLLLMKLFDRSVNIPVYTIHDCFATSPNNMEFLNKIVKESFIDIYFKEEGYLSKLHNCIIDQIKESHDIINIDGVNFVVDIDNPNVPDLIMPDLPNQFKNKELNSFVKGLLKSKYFIG